MPIDFEASSTQRIDVGLDIPGTNGKAGATIMAWINVESFTSLPSLGEWSVGPPPGTSGTSRIFFTVTATGQLQLGARDADTGGSQSLTSGVVITIGVWHHVVGVIGIANDSLEIFVDGVSVASSSPAFINTTFPATNHKNAAIGANDLGTGQNFDGLMEDYRLYSRVLSFAEIQTIHASRGGDDIVDSLEFRYKMNELSPGTVAATLDFGTVIDFGLNRRDIRPINSPIYGEGVIQLRRRGS